MLNVLLSFSFLCLPGEPLQSGGFGQVTLLNLTLIPQLVLPVDSHPTLGSYSRRHTAPEIAI